MSRYLLDTNICIFYMKAIRGVPEHIRSLPVIDLIVSEVTLAELKFGVARSEYRQRNQQHLDAFMQVVDVLPIAPALDVFASEKARLYRIGQPLPDFDLLIGATAIHHDMTLVTNNTKHFQRLKGIRLEDWTK